MNQKQFLRAIAQKRIEQYSTPREAAKSLDIDVRMLKRWAQLQESDH